MFVCEKNNMRTSFTVFICQHWRWLGFLAGGIEASAVKHRSGLKALQRRLLPHSGFTFITFLSAGGFYSESDKKHMTEVFDLAPSLSDALMSLPFVDLGSCFENISIYKTTESGLKSSSHFWYPACFNDLKGHIMFTTQPSSRTKHSK